MSRDNQETSRRALKDIFGQAQGTQISEVFSEDWTLTNHARFNGHSGVKQLIDGLHRRVEDIDLQVDTQEVLGAAAVETHWWASGKTSVTKEIITVMGTTIDNFDPNGRIRETNHRIFREEIMLPKIRDQH